MFGLYEFSAEKNFYSISIRIGGDQILARRAGGRFNLSFNVKLESFGSCIFLFLLSSFIDCLAAVIL